MGRVKKSKGKLTLLDKHGFFFILCSLCSLCYLFVGVNNLGCTRALYQHNAIDMVSSIVDTSMSKKPPLVSHSLVNTTSNQHLHFLHCSYDGHTNKYPKCLEFPKDQTQTLKSKKKGEIKG